MSRRTSITLVLAALVLACFPVQALEYEVHLLNGNVFHTRYEPVIAPFDANRIQLMTTNGNVISMPRESVKEVISVTEASGFGKRLDAMTILIGMASNDNPSPEEQAALEAQGGVAVGSPLTNPLVSEPENTGGMPLFFLNSNTPPIGGAGYTGGAADQRRGGGEGGQFIEPQTRD